MQSMHNVHQSKRHSDRSGGSLHNLYDNDNQSNQYNMNQQSRNQHQSHSHSNSVGKLTPTRSLGRSNNYYSSHHQGQSSSFTEASSNNNNSNISIQTLKSSQSIPSPLQINHHH
eukprot:127323_1